MALPNAVNGGEVTSIPSGFIIVGHAPAATVSGWQDYWMTSANFLKSITDDITSIEADITTIQGDIADLQDFGIFDQTLTGLSTGTTKSFTGNSLIEWVGIRVVSGTPTIKMGTGSTPPNDENIIPSMSVTGRNVIRIDYDTGSAGTTNLRITVSGGVCNFTFKITKNILI